jgi:hypothetical protein
VRSLASRRARASRGIHGGSECGRDSVDAATNGLPRVGKGHGRRRGRSYLLESGERVAERPRSMAARGCGGGDSGGQPSNVHGAGAFSLVLGIETTLGSATQSGYLRVTMLNLATSQKKYSFSRLIGSFFNIKTTNEPLFCNLREYIGSARDALKTSRVDLQSRDKNE